MSAFIRQRPEIDNKHLKDSVKPQAEGGTRHFGWPNSGYGKTPPIKIHQCLGHTFFGKLIDGPLARSVTHLVTKAFIRSQQQHGFRYLAI
jgi:hypothetical protein